METGRQWFELWGKGIYLSWPSQEQCCLATKTQDLSLSKENPQSWIVVLDSQETVNTNHIALSSPSFVFRLKLCFYDFKYLTALISILFLGHQPQTQMDVNDHKKKKTLHFLFTNKFTNLFVKDLLKSHEPKGIWTNLAILIYVSTHWCVSQFKIQFFMVFYHVNIICN